uniref:Uncharacterized protein n=1 Tax=Tanacetum cinerariifolium TaxID=118510 RepID=A0A699JIY0_TANCI|nr:hypothetical protein [Tanacetum cinerariifolium]
MFIKYSTGHIHLRRAKAKTSSKRRVKKKVTLFANDNIISDDPDASLELAKSISQTEAEEAKAANKVHATHARIVTEFVPESAKKKFSGRSSKSVVIRDTPKQEASNIMQALKESRKTRKREPGTGGSNEGTSSKPWVLDESIVISATLSEGTSIKLGVPNEENDITEEKDDKDGDADDEGDDHISDTQDADDDDVETESNEDDIYKYKIRVRKDEDEEMINAEVDDSDKGDKEVTDAAKAVAEKTSEAKDDPKKTELPLSSSSLFVSLEKDVFELKTIDHFTKALAIIKSQVPSVVYNYLRSKFLESTKKQTPTVNLEQGSEKSASEILQIKREQVEKQQKPNFTIKLTDKMKTQWIRELLTQLKTARESMMMKTMMMKTLQLDQTRVRRLRGEELKSLSLLRSHPSLRKPLKGKAQSKGSKTDKSDLAKEPVEEPIAEVVMDDASDDVSRDDNQPQDTSKPKTRKTLNPYWFKQPPRPLTLDPEWNKRQYMLNGLKIENLTQDILLGHAFNLLKGNCSSSIEFEYNFQECFNALTDKLDWNNLEGDRYPFDLSKPLPLQGPSGHRIVAADYVFNNDLDYLKTFNLEVTYTSSIMKTKAAQYEIKGIEDMVSKFSKHNVYSTKEILGVKSVSVKKLHGYGHLEEIVVKRSDQQLYKFKEGDFVDLHLNDIEDMLLLAVQHKLFHLDESVIVEFIVALRMFTRSLILKRRVEDLQLGVES